MSFYFSAFSTGVPQQPPQLPQQPSQPPHCPLSSLRSWLRMIKKTMTASTVIIITSAIQLILPVSL